MRDIPAGIAAIIGAFIASIATIFAGYLVYSTDNEVFAGKIKDDLKNAFINNDRDKVCRILKSFADIDQHVTSEFLIKNGSNNNNVLKMLIESSQQMTISRDKLSDLGMVFNIASAVSNEVAKLRSADLILFDQYKLVIVRIIDSECGKKMAKK